MCDTVYTDIRNMSASMMEVGEELKVALDKWTENRRCWVTDKVCRRVRRIRHANKEYRKMRRECGVNDERTESAKSDYFEEKEETKKIVSSALHTHNKEVMLKVGNNGKKVSYNHMHFLMVRGKQKKDESINIKDENGLFITDENVIVFEVEKL